jgi:hypothetical protein
MRQCDSCLIVCRERRVQIKIGLEVMVRALRQWLEANQLLAIVTGVVCTLVLLSMLMVFGGYMIVAR